MSERVIIYPGHTLTAWNCREPWDGPTTTQQTCENPECAR